MPKSIRKVGATTCLIVLLGLTATRRAAAISPIQVTAGALQHGTVEQRLEALVDILKIPPDQRDAQLWRAIRQEATRMLNYRRSRSARHDSPNEHELNESY